MLSSKEQSIMLACVSPLTYLQAPCASQLRWLARQLPLMSALAQVPLAVKEAIDKAPSHKKGKLLNNLVRRDSNGVR